MRQKTKSNLTAIGIVLTSFAIATLISYIAIEFIY